MSTPEVQTQTPVQGVTLPLPKIGFFVVDGFKYKYALPSVNPIDCVHYVSRSGLTFRGCLKVFLEGNGITTDELMGGLYGSFIEPLISLQTRRKMSRNLSEMKSYIVRLIGELKDNLEIGNKELLVYYDNNVIQVYDKFIKAKDIEVSNLVLTTKYESHTVKVYKLDNYTLDANDFEEYLSDSVDYHVRISTDRRALLSLWTPWRQSYEAILLIANDSVKIFIEDESGVLTSPGLYLILIH